MADRDEICEDETRVAELEAEVKARGEQISELEGFLNVAYIAKNAAESERDRLCQDREQLAREIEAIHPARINSTSVHEQLAYKAGIRDAASIVRAATADTDPAPDNTTERT